MEPDKIIIVVLPLPLGNEYPFVPSVKQKNLKLEDVFPLYSIRSKF